jgi:hypothetical protein
MSEQHTFVALYSGKTVQTATLIAASADRHLVRLAAKQMLREAAGTVHDDPLTRPIANGRKQSLQRIAEPEEEGGRT